MACLTFIQDSTFTPHYRHALTLAFFFINHNTYLPPTKPQPCLNNLKSTLFIRKHITTREYVLINPFSEKRPFQLGMETKKRPALRHRRGLCRLGSLVLKYRRNIEVRSTKSILNRLIIRSIFFKRPIRCQNTAQWLIILTEKIEQLWKAIMLGTILSLQ